MRKPAVRHASSVFSVVALALAVAAGASACSRDRASGTSTAGQAPAAAPAPTPTAAPAAAAPAADGVKRFGAPLSAGPALELDTVLAAPEKHAGSKLKVRGTITSVCQAKGCWMALKGTSRPETVRVRFKDYGFFVPTNTADGTIATCEGELQVKTLSEADAKHYAGETKGVTKEQVAAIKGPQRELTFIASGVELAARATRAN